MNENAKTRLAILEVLYKVRETEPIGETKWLCEDEFDITLINRDFALSVLDELELVRSVVVNHQLHYAITATGVLACEQGQSQC
jgi:hypothetical protein